MAMTCWAEVTYPLHLSSISTEQAREGGRRVGLLVKPPHILLQNGREGALPQPCCHALPIDTEARVL